MTVMVTTAYTDARQGRVTFWQREGASGVT